MGENLKRTDYALGYGGAHASKCVDSGFACDAGL